MTYDVVGGLETQQYSIEREISMLQLVGVARWWTSASSEDVVKISSGYSTQEIKTHAEVSDALAVPEFKAFPSINRLSDEFEMVLTEKIDGQNAQVLVPENPCLPVLAGKRSCWIEPGKQDINGFAAWVRANEDALRLLGAGRHYGEWWGQSIQRNYGLAERRFSLFNYRRFPGGLPRGLPPEVRIVPVLYRGEVSQVRMREVIAELFATGSRAEPGWMKPEGVVVTIGAQTWKFTDRENKPKWMTRVES